MYACLDCIPGEIGKVATTKQRQDAAEITWENYLYMKREGLDPIPVFHYGEDFRYLERMLDAGCEYIGIGGLVSVPGPNRRDWLDRVFLRITDDAGKPIVKTHGFGMTSVSLIFRYPWHSVDSTSWIKTTSMGAVYFPARRDGEFVFDETPSTIFVSNLNPGQKNNNSKHANNLSSAARILFEDWLRECGKTFAEVADSYFHRATCNVTFFRKVSETKLDKPFERQSNRRSSLWL